MSVVRYKQGDLNQRNAAGKELNLQNFRHIRPHRSIPLSFANAVSKISFLLYFSYNYDIQD